MSMTARRLLFWFLTIAVFQVSPRRKSYSSIQNWCANASDSNVVREKGEEEEVSSKSFPSDGETILIKIGGSSITHKGTEESLNTEMLDWLSESISFSKSNGGCNSSEAPKDTSLSTSGSCPAAANVQFILIHGAGSFGHFHAKRFGLKGMTFPSQDEPPRRDHHPILGLSQTRLSVQTLNRHVVTSLVHDHQVPAVGISPCFAITSKLDSRQHFQESLQQIVQETLNAGIIPVLHGDACLFASSTTTMANDDDTNNRSSGSTVPGILSGDVLMEVLASMADRAIFMTDVEGIFTSDPRRYPPTTAKLLSQIIINEEGEILTAVHQNENDVSNNNGTTGSEMMMIQATESSHNHDVTGGLKTKLASASKMACTTIQKNKDEQQNHPIVHVVQSGSESAQGLLRGQEAQDIVDFKGTQIICGA